MWLIKASLRNPYMVAAFVFMLIILGSLSILSIPIDILPVFKAPAVQVLTYYPGMPASSIEKTITNRIERWVNQAPGARLVESRSVPGVSVVKVYFDSLKKELQSNLRFLVLVIKHGLESELETAAKGMKGCIVWAILAKKAGGINIIGHDQCAGIKVPIKA
jgi:multidrug efflux pump subunit AcrB